MSRAHDIDGIAPSFQRISRIVGIAVAATGVAVMVAWIVHFDRVTNVLPGLASMKFNTALGFLLVGVALYAGGAPKLPRSRRRIANAMPWAVLLLALLTLAEYTFGFNAGIDELFVRDPATQLPEMPGRMSVGTAVSFVLIAASLLTLELHRHSRYAVSQTLALLVLLLGAAALLGYIFGERALYSFSFFSSMAVHTAVLFVVLSIGVLMLRTDHGFTAVIASPRIGGQMSRLLLPPVLAGPLVLCWLSLAGAEAGLYDLGFAFALSCLSGISFLAVVVWIGARSLNAMHDTLEQRGRQSAHLAAIVAGSDDAIISTQLDGTVLSWNQGAEKLYGYREHEMLGEPILRVVPPELVEEEQQMLADIARGAHIKHLETVRLNKDGRRIDLSLIVSPIRDETGRLVGASKVARDITERKRVEQELLTSTLELERSNKDLEQFAYVASHDLQEPLRAVSGCMQLLQRRYHEQLDERGEEFIRHAVDGANRMQQLIDDLLRYSRVGRTGDEFRDTRVEQSLDRALKNLASAIRESGATVTHGELPTVRAVPSQLSLLLQNLVANAIKFRQKEQAPKVSVTADQRDDVWEFAVADNGIGIATEYFDRVFAIFQRLHARRDYPGTGIGLAMCKRIVEHHGGRIWIESRESRGTTVRFTLPVSAHDRND